MLKTTKAQSSLIMILILAVAFIFYAITLNWTKIASLKTNTWMAAVTSASQGASMFASYGERVMQEQLLPLGGIDYNGGELEHCDDGFFQLLFKIFVIIVMIIITILTWGATSYLLVIAIGMMVASLLIEYLVIRPMVFNMWNKLQQNLLPIDQFRESAIVGGLQQIINDSIKIPDRFDLDANGKWGIPPGNDPRDKISRFALYYTERLKLVKPPDTAAYEGFKTALNNLIINPPPALQTPPAPAGLGFTSYCTAGSSIPYNGNGTLYSSQCDLQCTGIAGRPIPPPAQHSNATGWNYQNTPRTLFYVPDRLPHPPTTPSYITPTACLLPCQSNSIPSTCPAFLDPAQRYSLLYDPSLEQNPVAVDPLDQRNSFRYRLGHDDEIQSGANTNFLRSSGLIFPMLHQMYVTEITTRPLANPTNQAQLSGPTYATFQNTFSDVIIPPLSYQAADNVCAQEQDTGGATGGFYWKKGADRYCSGFEDNPAYRRDLTSITSNPNVTILWGANFATPGMWPNQHYPYFQCPYMFDAGTGAPQACVAAAAAQWPQDRVDNIVYGLSELIKVNQSLQSMDLTTLINNVDQWYQQIQPFIAPKCGLANYTARIDQFVLNNFPYMSVFAEDPNICNRGKQGSMIQWLYDMRNWLQQLNQPVTGWLNQSFGVTPPDLCSGTMANIITCLATKIIPIGNVEACDQWLTAHPFVPPQTLDASCLNTFNAWVATPTNFFTNPPGTVTAGSINPVTDPGVSTDFRTWIRDNRILMQATRSRRDLLNLLNNNARSAAVLFQEASTEFGAFLAPGGPVENILNAIKSHKASRTRLPSFAIYGWKDQRTIRNNTSAADGLWHLARLEVKQPDKLPWLRAEGRGFLNSTTCFTFMNGFGDVWVRVTRWDDSLSGGLVRFANGIPIWRFRSDNPHAPPVNARASDLDSECHDNQTGMGFGLTPEMVRSLQISMFNNPVFPSNAEERKAYREVFMLNLDPDVNHYPPDAYSFGTCPSFSNAPPYCSTVASDYSLCCAASNGGYYGAYWQRFCQDTNVEHCRAHTHRMEHIEMANKIRPCYNATNELLQSGVQAYAGARFGVPNSTPYHESIFFHSSSYTKGPNGAHFPPETFNDVPN